MKYLWSHKIQPNISPVVYETEEIHERKEVISAGIRKADAGMRVSLFVNV
jgi:hypothetical protein